MSIFLLIRHGDTDYVNEALAGRIDSSLNQEGFKQAEDLASQLKDLPITAIYTSPLLRARQTAQPLVNLLGIQPMVVEGINQVDFGLWQGISFEELDSDPKWQAFSRNPAAMDCPGGESAYLVRERVTETAYALRDTHNQSDIIVLFTHGSIIRHFVSSMINLPLENLNLLTVAPGSVTTIEMKKDRSKLRHLNQHVPISWL